MGPTQSVRGLILPVAKYGLYERVLISLWLFIFAAQPKEFFLDGLKKLEQRSHKCLWSSGGGNYVE
jgi:hypothetical protein